MVTLTFLDQQLAWKGAHFLQETLSILTRSRLLLVLAQATTLVTVSVVMLRVYFARSPRVLSTTLPWLILLSSLALPVPLSMTAYPSIYPDTRQQPPGAAPSAPSQYLPWEWVAKGKYHLATTGSADIVYVPRPYWLILSLTDSLWSGVTTGTAQALQDTFGRVPAHMARISATVNAQLSSPAIQEAVEEFLEKCGLEFADPQRRPELSATCTEKLHAVDTLADSSLRRLGLTQNKALRGASRVWAESALGAQIEFAHLKQQALAFDALTGGDGTIDRIKKFVTTAAARLAQYLVLGSANGLMILFKTYLADAVGPHAFSLVNGVMNLVLALSFPITMILSFVPIIGWRAYVGFWGLAFVVRSLPYFYLVITSFQGLSWKMLTAFVDQPVATSDSGSIVVNALYSSGFSLDLGAFRGAAFEDLVVTQFALQFAQFALLYGLPILACFVIFDILVSPNIAAIRSFHQTHKVSSGASGVPRPIASKGKAVGKAAYTIGRTIYHSVGISISTARSRR